MSVDLTSNVNKVIEARTVEEKKSALLEMIETSHAKKETKTFFTNKIKYTSMSIRQLDKMAYDYMMSGEGMKVR